MIIGLTGATGFIGTHLTAAATAAGHSVVAFSRQANAVVPGAAEVRRFETGAGPDLSRLSVVVHLAGESVFGLWTARKRKKILESRVTTTRQLVEAMAAAIPRPAALICASGIGYYGDRGDEPLNESSARGSGFLSDVTEAWETEAGIARQHGIRTVCGRIGLVLGPDGGAWPSLRRVFRLGLGGRLGSGRQWMSWVHVSDVVALLLAAAADERHAGAVNWVAPTPGDQPRIHAHGFEMSAASGHPPRAGFALRTILRDQSGLFLDSQRVIPTKALRLGHRFGFPTLETALADLCAKKNRGDHTATAVAARGKPGAVLSPEDTGTPALSSARKSRHTFWPDRRGV